MESETPAYYAVIPANVRYAKIPPNAKLLFWEITSLANKHWYCYASNQYFAELYEVRSEQISRWISILEKEHFITLEIDISKWNSRNIFIRNEFGGIAPKRNRSCAKTQEGIAQKRKYNNKYNNIYILSLEKEKQEEILDKMIETFSSVTNKKTRKTPSLQDSFLKFFKKWNFKDLDEFRAAWNTALENYFHDIQARNPHSDYSKHRFSLYEFLTQKNGFERFYNL